MTMAAHRCLPWVDRCRQNVRPWGTPVHLLASMPANPSSIVREHPQRQDGAPSLLMQQELADPARAPDAPNLGVHSPRPPPTSGAVRGSAGYGANAPALVQQYESVSFEDVHRDVLHLFPEPPSHVLDIGAGSGRDAAALARRGHHVVAVEPTAELREAGRQLHGALAIDWVDDHLPSLAVVRQSHQRFDLILLTAVWMHLDEAERKTAAQAIAPLLTDAGQLMMTLRHGPVPPGRTMFDVSAQETIELLARSGLRSHHHSQREDMLGRPDVRWSLLAFHRIEGEPHHA